MWFIARECLKSSKVACFVRINKFWAICNKVTQWCELVKSYDSWFKCYMPLSSY